MAYWTWAKDQVGSFVEKSAGNVFEYSLNDEDFNQPDFPHKIWVGDLSINLGSTLFQRPWMRLTRPLSRT